MAELSGYRTVSRSIVETMAIGVSLTSKNGSLWPRTALKFNSLLVLKCLPGRHFCSWVFDIVVQSLSPVQLCNPVDCSTSSFPVLHYLPEFVQIDVQSWSCYLTISSSVALFSFCRQSFPASGSFPMRWPFASSGQDLGASVSTSVLPMNISADFL